MSGGIAEKDMKLFAGFANDVSIEGNLIEAGFLQQAPQPLLERLAERDVTGLVQH